MTFCTIFGTALATDVAVQLFGKRGVGLATLAVTAVTLFFGEILPKSLAVTKPESVARAPGAFWMRSPLSAALRLRVRGR